MTSSSAAPGSAPQTCPACGAAASGKFCSSCGAPFVGASCTECGASLTPGARFCHRCGTAVGTAPATAATEQRGFSSSLPWAVAAIALVALVALVAGQRFGRSQSDGVAPAGAANAAAPFAGGGSGAPPDISNMSPAEAAARLYDRVMAANERGRADTVQIFAPMAIAAYQMIPNPNLDERYDLGRLAAVSGDAAMARAEADTILAAQPTHLLGLVLAAQAARMRKDVASERQYHDKLVAAAPAERAKQLPEYAAHSNDIQIALEAKRP